MSAWTVVAIFAIALFVIQAARAIVEEYFIREARRRAAAKREKLNREIEKITKEIENAKAEYSRAKRDAMSNESDK